MIRQWMARFMVGRYGMDQLNVFLMVLYLVLYVVFLFTHLIALDFIVLVLLFVTLFRMLSRNIDRRRAENAKFLQLTGPICRRFKSCRTRMQDREHRYFKCPNCGQHLRVPKGKGKITVTCRGCGATFQENS